MSETHDVAEVIDLLRYSPDGQIRADAATWLGQAAAQMDDADYDLARHTLNDALTDRDPMVLMAAMQALGAFNRQGKAHGTAGQDVAQDEAPLATASACAVCGKPEMLIQAKECEEAKCPYR